MSDGGALLPALFGHMVLTALPMVAAALAAARSGVRSVPILIAIGLVAGGVVAVLAFWAYYADPVLGEAFGFLVVLGAVALAAASLRGGAVDPGLLRALAVPLALWALGSAFLVFLGFAHGGADTALATAGSRFSGPLPSDNDIPRFYAEWFFHNGHAGDAPLYPADWLSSDRPPLQVGYVLSQRTFGWDDTGLHYQVLGVLLQQLWILGAWALLLAARLGRLTRALAIVTLLVSDVAIVNGFYVWPKLLPAAFLLAAAALILTPLWSSLRRDPRAGALVAALFALAMLGHGSSVFGIVPLALVAAYRGLPSLRWVGAALLAAVVLIAPWSAYQSYVDPPASRLTKWMLAGVTEIDDRSTTRAIADSYREAGVGGMLDNKAQNFATMVGGEPAWELGERALSAVGDGKPEEAVGAVRSMSFFGLLPSLGLLALAPLAMAVGFRRRGRDPAQWRFALTCFAAVLVGCLAWGLLLFGNEVSRTSLHVGSLALPILALCGCVAGLRAVLPRFAVYYVTLAAALSLALYAPSFEPPPGTAWSALAIMLASLSLTGFLAVAFRAGDAVEDGSTLAR
ncbi:MAG TPA: hypothetical protein VNP96_09155 [Solirubrobacterales bacterium]|nr:hypothetical protein [Solirubrobacterales bacterium]